MEIRQLRSFQTVANLLSFNKAADRLNYAQSSISAQIQALEEELAVQLFDRLGRRVVLTEAGTQLLEYANKILDLVDESHSEMAAEKQPLGSLTIRIPETFGSHRLPPVIKEFHNRFPKVKLNFITCAHEGLEKDLRKGLTDLAFLLTESFQTSDLMAETLGFESVVLVAGGADRDELPAVDQPQAVAILRLVHVVGRHEDRDPPAGLLVDQIPEAAPRQRVDPGGRLVEKDDWGLVKDGAAERQPLPPAARQIPGRSFRARL